MDVENRQKGADATSFFFFCSPEKEKPAKPGAHSYGRA